MPKGVKKNVKKAQKTFSKKNTNAKKQVAKEQKKHGKGGSGAF